MTCLCVGTRRLLLSPTDNVPVGPWNSFSAADKRTEECHIFLFYLLLLLLSLLFFYWPILRVSFGGMGKKIRVNVRKTMNKKSELLFMTEQSCCTCGAGRRRQTQWMVSTVNQFFFFISWQSCETRFFNQLTAACFNFISRL